MTLDQLTSIISSFKPTNGILDRIPTKLLRRNSAPNKYYFPEYNQSIVILRMFTTIF